MEDKRELSLGDRDLEKNEYIKMMLGWDTEVRSRRISESYV